MDNTASSDDATIDLPDVIRRYQDAHDRHDTETALATFTPDARVIDEEHEHKGTDDIRHWLRTAATEFTYTRTLVTADALEAKTWLVVNHLEGDFPGGVVDLRYRFRLSGGLISELVIAP
ncbi:MAG: nuclear transport factor 2 family protein [Actinomycetota bacterium]|nr:nuclear transport factor 2 family protein [Actinomycetota bacterium]